jgi:TrmH family RNA methyltransferase
LTGSPLGFRHQKVQRLRKLLRKRSARDAERAFVAEGVKVVSEALHAGVSVESAYAAPGAPGDLLDRLIDAGASVHTLERDVMERIADAVTPQPVAAIVPYVDVELASVHEATMLVVCVDLRDPGNAGTVLRTAEASGADGVLFCQGSVDVYNPKTVRASAGSLFHVPIVTGSDPADLMEQLGAWEVRRLGSVAHDGDDYAAADLRSPVAFVLGNEASGLDEKVLAACDGRVTIPMHGHSDSLNVGMAAAVLCFEAARQRRAS